MTANAPERFTPGDHEQTLTVDKRERSYLLHVPPQYEDGTPMPLVIAFHGGGSNGQQMVEFSGLSDKADEAGFLVVYPEGTGRLEGFSTFNGGNCCGYAQRQNIDDVKFSAAVLDDVEARTSVDVKRVYATGISNGGLMSYRLADELSDRIAAIAPVAGPMGKETCNPNRAVSVIHFHGTNDKFCKYEGGAGQKSRTGTKFISVKHSIDTWVKTNGCAAEGTEEELPAGEDDDMQVTKTSYGPGEDDAEVVLYTIHGGGHTWPGMIPKFRFLGPSTLDISANDLMWEFFQKHPLK